MRLFEINQNAENYSEAFLVTEERGIQLKDEAAKLEDEWEKIPSEGNPLFSGLPGVSAKGGKNVLELCQSVIDLAQDQNELMVVVVILGSMLQRFNCCKLKSKGLPESLIKIILGL